MVKLIDGGGYWRRTGGVLEILVRGGLGIDVWDLAGLVIKGWGWWNIGFELRGLEGVGRFGLWTGWC